MIDLTLTREERIYVLMRRANMTNAMMADRCGVVAGRKATHQMVSELLRPQKKRANMSERVYVALLAACEVILRDPDSDLPPSYPPLSEDIKGWPDVTSGDNDEE